jgi:hypothetical protein
MRRQDIEGNYRRAWLLTALLEDYFCVRGMWYEGPKKAIHWLRAYDFATLQALEKALQPAAPPELIDPLVARVIDISPQESDAA